MSKNSRVMIVDDNAHMAEVLAEMLDIFNISTVSVQDGEIALRALNEEPVSLVITDLRMPKMSGVDLLKSIKAQSPEIPVVVISGFTMSQEDDQVVREIADGFLNKPFRMEDIEQLLERLT